jgi:hypothetical protein
MLLAMLYFGMATSHQEEPAVATVSH